mgnify:CR=1 FL=1
MDKVSEGIALENAASKAYKSHCAKFRKKETSAFRKVYAHILAGNFFCVKSKQEIVALIATIDANL